ncbi:MAG TPA: glutamate-cysteine ligase family protein, partial [Kofleriaceae bacterium]|nr:glutamate-cysteine ligase family protein [Kofleriaceae bacterium]
DSLVAMGWARVTEDGHTIALEKGAAQVTLEPGGQLEHAARPVSRQEDLVADVRAYLAQVAVPSRKLGLAWLAIGFRPFGTIDQVPWMPKQRYAVMREFLPPRGHLAPEMMKRTATVQVNLDYADADDAKEKLRCVMSITSVLTALYACSPIVDEAVSGFQSYRSFVWTATDPARCGLLPLAFSDGDVFRNYAEWALDVPMFFLYRGTYRALDGRTFRQFARDGFEGHRATMDDWELHLSTLFPEARLKRFLEVRGCDAGSLEMNVALGPLCRGLLYDATARSAATDLTAELDMDQRIEFWHRVARQGLAARVPGRRGITAGELGRELCAIATDGLSRLAPEEDSYLDPVRAIAESGRTQADAIIELWHQSGGDRAQIIAELCHRGLG